MPLGLAIIALLLIVTAIKGTTTALGAQLKTDLIGDGVKSGFIVWVVILAILGGIGSFAATNGRKDVQKLVQLFIVLLLIALVLKTPKFLQNAYGQITGVASAPKVDADITAVEKVPVNKGGDLLEGVAGDNKGNEKSQEVLGIKTSDLVTYGSYAIMLL